MTHLSNDSEESIGTLLVLDDLPLERDNFLYDLLSLVSTLIGLSEHSSNKLSLLLEAIESIGSKKKLRILNSA